MPWKVMSPVHIDPAAFFATITAAVAGFIISSTTKDGRVSLPIRLLIVLCVAASAHLLIKFVEDKMVVTFPEKIEGQWLEVFSEAPNPKQQYTIAYITYDHATDAIALGGYGFDQSGKRLSTWTTTEIVANSPRKSILYRYSGEIFNEAEAIDGIGWVQFHPNLASGAGDIVFGIGAFREEYSAYKKVEYEMVRITPELSDRLIGKRALDVDDYTDFVKAYHAGTQRPTEPAAGTHTSPQAQP